MSQARQGGNSDTAAGVPVGDPYYRAHGTDVDGFAGLLLDIYRQTVYKQKEKEREMNSAMQVIRAVPVYVRAVRGSEIASMGAAMVTLWTLSCAASLVAGMAGMGGSWTVALWAALAALALWGWARQVRDGIIRRCELRAAQAVISACVSDHMALTVLPGRHVV
jgi:hypothetical protein